MRNVSCESIVYLTIANKPSTSRTLQLKVVLITSIKPKEIPPYPECHLKYFAYFSRPEEDNEPTSNFLSLVRVPVAEQKEENEFTAAPSAESNIYLKDKYESDKYTKFQKISTCHLLSNYILQIHKFKI
ncbi:uncharacterized protein LOC122711586 isoform X2 [Apis laboriosa]|uniref:uncharacterized protein LOC122711586 isoform X2 n=1 Tax=Apis laboriosa TaxID=183418 RepID=UPI001CC351BF|nr:uncharacterized protein LOC122711586 isoform X2 [Apis laboriosa]